MTNISDMIAILGDKTCQSCKYFLSNDMCELVLPGESDYSNLAPHINFMGCCNWEKKFK